MALTEKTSRDEYREAHRKYLTDGGEESLLVGYEIGRETIADGLTSLVALHGEALKDALGQIPFLDELAMTIDRSTQFLEETLAPFEMTVRGFQESNDRLIQANRELKRAEETEKRFLANMSHELRTPLNAILGFAELLIDDRDFEIELERRRTYLETIHRSGKHLLDLINDILDLARVDAGRMAIETEAIDSRDAVADAIALVEPLTRERGVSIEARGEGGAIVSADRGRLRQILLNLISNAIKFTDDGGRVQVRAYVDGQNVRFEVIDTGIGIAPEDQDRLFHDFEQLPAARDQMRQGTGLGLALSRRLVELHGGTIGLVSAPNQGSTFWFTIPMPSSTAPASPQPSDIEREQPSGPLVLVVEDDPRAAELLTEYLHSAGYQTEVAVDGMEALEKARRLRPSAITLDVLLPKLDGWNVLAQLKLDPSTHKIPVVVVSVVDERSHGRALGAADYFVKPVSRDALIAWLNRFSLGTRIKQRGVKILIVDDDPDARQVLNKMLATMGFSVIEADSGEEGIQLARQHAPDAVILDLVMPRMSGFEVVRVLKAELYTRAIPIVVVTAKEMSETDKAALKGDVRAVLAKGSMASIDLSTWLQEALGSATH